MERCKRKGIMFILLDLYLESRSAMILTTDEME
jgi:hypothetical protein